MDTGLVWDLERECGAAVGLQGSGQPQCGGCPGPQRRLCAGREARLRVMVHRDGSGTGPQSSLSHWPWACTPSPSDHLRETLTFNAGLHESGSWERKARWASALEVKKSPHGHRLDRTPMMICGSKGGGLQLARGPEFWPGPSPTCSGTWADPPSADLGLSLRQTDEIHACLLSSTSLWSLLLSTCGVCGAGMSRCSPVGL